MSKVILVAGMSQNVPVLKGYDYIGIDHGAISCIKQHIPMVCAVGDFDSVNDEEKAMIEKATDIMPLPAHKNETDTEVAIFYAMEHQYEEIILYGGLGGRIDHELANLYLLIHREYPIILMNEQNRIQLLKEGHYKVKKDAYQYLSFLALCDSCISEENVAYPLSKQEISTKDIYTVSNEIIHEEADITIHKGKVLMIQTRDA
ncbi:MULTISPECIES: thiamine diphosphokinase [Bacillota]|jgi:thiamine pyrophosphokinase|uniref:Thiamine diphosphokinase n=2 Tax=Amedibacillus TaxID=2749846 RepID=A0A7G9GJN7_9FIRM|nr:MULTISPECIES: thiamine diphosphokinase [Bacillota]QNM11019.1 thiamine diphosphokinase [[Eubacterium] hominis]MCH4286448.1 thiamine diphosphokinase [Amedibacillus hominis]RGB58509.1 thiamine diphosphokinase [Absiella sp. AM22-9]RGB63397.1 thiamine diphosphokinase [Absiella sp. AM10-20]RGB63629.1 thiamine diphosphokinase [Absiella sp. AM09-45]